MNVIPSSGAVLTQLQYTVFSERDVQTLGIIGSASSLVGSLLFGCLNRCGMRRTFFFATLVSLVVNLSALPFVYVVGSHPAMHDIWSQVGGLAVISTVFGGITGMFTILPMDTLITAASGSFRASQSSTAYAVLLSLTAFGNSVGGLISAPIVKSLGLDGYSNWDNLLLWVIVTAALRLLVLPMLALIPSKSLRPASASDLGPRAVQTRCPTNTRSHPITRTCAGQLHNHTTPHTTTTCQRRCVDMAPCVLTMTWLRETPGDATTCCECRVKSTSREQRVIRTPRDQPAGVSASFLLLSTPCGRICAQLYSSRPFQLLYRTCRGSSQLLYRKSQTVTAMEST